MRKSIFELENRIDIKKEFDTIIRILYEEDKIIYNYRKMSLFELLNLYVFNEWKYRDTYTDLQDYMNFIGIKKSMIYGNIIPSEEAFLNLLELLLNLFFVMDKYINMDEVNFLEVKTKKAIIHNIPIILEKLNYEYYRNKDTLLLRKRDADVDSVLDMVPKDIANLLLSYNDVRNRDIESRKSILKKLDLYLDKNKEKYKNIGGELITAIDTIMNNMGINHLSNKEQFCKLTENELSKWYDDCFKLIIHLIRTEDIIRIKKARNDLVNKKE